MNARDRADAVLVADTVTQLRAENERLRAALHRYGLHTWDCAWNDSRGEQPCDCGWAEVETALTGIQGGSGK